MFKEILQRLSLRRKTTYFLNIHVCIDFYFNANLNLPTLKSKLIQNFFAVTILKKILLESFIRSPAILVATKRSRSIDKTSRQSMILGQVTKIDQFSAARNGVLCEKKIKKSNDNLMLMFSLSSCSNFLCQRDIEYFVYFKEKLMPTKKRYLLHFLKRIFNHFRVYCTDIFCIELVEIGSLFC